MSKYIDIITELRGKNTSALENESADIIEALEKEIDELKGTVELWKGIQQGTLQLLKEKETRVSDFLEENKMLKNVKKGRVVVQACVSKEI